MKRAILIVAPFLPWPVDFGGAARVFHLARYLTADHEVILCAPATAAEATAVGPLGDFFDVVAAPVSWSLRQPAGWRKRGAQLRALASGDAFLSGGDRARRLQPVIDRLFLTRRIDLVQFEFSQMASLTTPRPCPTLVDIHNVEHELLRQISQAGASDARAVYNTLEAARVRAHERRVWRRASGLVATSEADAARISQVVGSTPAVVPNGVDCDEFAASNTRTDRDLIVFTGAMRHAPNADGARWYLDHVHPLVIAQVPEARLAIVGADPPSDLMARATRNVEVTGRLDDIRDWLHRARVAIVPLRSGSGTRLKILEALASGVPVVSTSIGAEGLELKEELDILLADSPSGFAAAVVRVLRDDVLAARLAARGPATARQRFDWSVVGARLAIAVDETIRRFADSERLDTSRGAGRRY